MNQHRASAKESDEKAAALEKEAGDLRRKAEKWRAVANDIQRMLGGT